MGIVAEQARAVSKVTPAKAVGAAEEIDDVGELLKLRAREVFVFIGRG